MASTLLAMGLQSTSNGLQPTSNGLQPTSDGLQPKSDLFLVAWHLFLVAWHLLLVASTHLPAPEFHWIPGLCCTGTTGHRIVFEAFEEEQ